MFFVDWTPEYIEGHVTVGLLCSNNIDAYLFDENFVRLDWFAILGYGGFRIMVPGHSALEARQLISDFRSGKFEFSTEDSPSPICPRCQGNHTEPDPRPRRRAFFAYMMVSLVAFFPALLRLIVYGRYRCIQCRKAWREPRYMSFGRQQIEAEAALSSSNP